MMKENEVKIGTYSLPDDLVGNAKSALIDLEGHHVTYFTAPAVAQEEPEYVDPKIKIEGKEEISWFEMLTSANPT